MPLPKFLLIGRKAIAENLDSLREYLAVAAPRLAIVECDADRDAAKQIVEDHCIAQFSYLTAIVADFPGCLVVNDDGSVERIVLTPAPEQKPEPLIQVVG